jgi:para-aminobenzoate synthetase component 1
VSSLGEGDWKEGVEEIRERIAAGDVYQVNLCRVLSAPLDVDSGGVTGLGWALATRHPAPYSAVVSVPSAGVEVASASPELFLRRSGSQVWSSPIKGTAASFDGFLPKDRAENVMIVDLVRNDLGRVCVPGSIAVPSLCAVESHPGLHHLVSTVTGRLREGCGWAPLLDATFPPGSVTGAPKLAALAQIAALEPVSRGPYTGAVGWVDADAGEGELNVAIRTFWLADGRIHFGTGGGITWDSTPDGEWEETELKARALLSVASS